MTPVRPCKASEGTEKSPKMYTKNCVSSAFNAVCSLKKVHLEKQIKFRYPKVNQYVKLLQLLQFSKLSKFNFKSNEAFA